MISGFGMLAPLLAVLVWADRKLTIGGPGGRRLPRGLSELFSARRPPTGNRLTGIRRAPYSIRTPLAKELPGVSADAVPPLDASGRFGQGLRFRALARRG